MHSEISTCWSSYPHLPFTFYCLIVNVSDKLLPCEIYSFEGFKSTALQWILKWTFYCIFNCNYLGKEKDQIHRKCVTVRVVWGERHILHSWTDSWKTAMLSSVLAIYSDYFCIHYTSLSAVLFCCPRCLWNLPCRSSHVVTVLYQPT
jgi:hypothetical protein